MKRRTFLRLMVSTAPLAAVNPVAFLAPISLPPTPERVLMVSNPTGPSWLKDSFVDHDRIIYLSHSGVQAIYPDGQWVSLSREIDVDEARRMFPYAKEGRSA